MRTHPPLNHAFRALWLGAIFMASAPLHAQNLQSRTCEAWNTARKANLSTAVQREWLFGYVNGWRDAQLAFAGKDVFETMPALEVLIEKTNAFCEQQAEAKVNQVLARLLPATQ